MTLQLVIRTERGERRVETHPNVRDALDHSYWTWLNLKAHGIAATVTVERPN